jgi:hypothetical protein
MRVRSRTMPVLGLAVVAASLALTACEGNGDEAAAASSAGGTRCTDQIDYTGDPRSHPEINSIGAETGACPAPLTDETPEGTPKEPGLRCTDQIDYTGDPRSNADINSIGEWTGYCPPVEQG